MPGQLLLHAGMIVAGLITSPATARADFGDDPRVDFDAWFQRLVELDQAAICHEPVLIAWRVESPPPPNEFVEALAAEVEGKPVHPKRAQYEAILRTHGQPTWSEYRLWREGNIWRLSEDTWDKAFGFFDRGVTERLAWTLTPSQMVRANRGGTSGSYHLARTEAQAGAEILYFFNGRLPKAAFAEAASRPRFDGHSAWSLVFERPASAGTSTRLVARGSFDPSAGWGTVDELVWTTKSPTGTETTDTTSLGGWHPSDLPGLGVCERVSFKSRSTPLLTRTMTLKEFRRVTPDEVRRIAQPPDVKAPDPVRGVPTFRQIQDFSGTNDGGVAAQDIDRTANKPLTRSAALQVPPSQSATPPTGPRTILWILACVIAATLVFLRLRRHA